MPRSIAIAMVRSVRTASLPSRSLMTLPAVVALFAIVPESGLVAQSAPPRANVSITKLPTLESNLWPADFNGDGRTDIVAGRSSGDLVVRLGLGNGTFDAERVVASGISPVTVGDFNADSHTDIVAVGPETESGAELFVLAGRGDGTFVPAVPIAGGAGSGFNVSGLTADFNADGHRDLAVLAMAGDAVRIFPGNGDLTFGAHMSLVTGPFSRQFIVAHLNADSRPDIAVATQLGRAVDVFLNDGGLLFTHTSIPFDRAALGITAWDMNGDGPRDLVVTTGLAEPFGDTFTSGEVNILLSRGDGTFDAPMTFVTGNGPISVVGGDFNRDGISDVATGNLSEAFDRAGCDSYAFLWDSVSVLPGLGDGRLGAPASFALGNSREPPDGTVYRQRHHTLKTSDLNGDRQTDLIASPGAVLLNAAPAANRAPVANAGADRNVPRDPGPGGTSLLGSATDPDNDWLTWEWRDQAGKTLGRLPRVCVFDSYQGKQTFTLTVTDGRGGVSTDTVTYTFGFPLPDGWQSGDVGAVGAAGSSTFDGTTYSVTGSGADIWGTADEFHFAQTTMSGDFEFTASVPYVQNVNRWTKAGLMIRDGAAPSARHASIFATPTTERGVAFQRRPTAGGTSVHTAGPAAAPPVWLRLRREGNVIRAFSRISETAPWTLIGSQTFSALPDSLSVGLAVTSHVDGTLAEARFENVSLNPIAAPAFQSNDIGATAAAGSSSTDGTTYTVTGSGADVWGTADEFHFFSREVTGDFDFAARAASVQHVHAWTKAGLMLREGLAANARHAFILATPTTTKGVAFQRRPTTGGISVHTGGPAVAPPQWLRLVRTGNVVTAYHRSSSSAPWTAIGSQTFTSLPATVRVGFATGSHVDGTRATARFDNVSLTQ
jgi:hypothetical protein